MKFPAGTTGHQLDMIARKPLWDAGLDYDHGTGHGVGSFLGVHEGPQRIAKAPNTQALKPGMILSNEPGYYKAGAYGIRIENLIVVTAPEPIPGGEREMMSFETITLAPINLDLVNVALLLESERQWLNDYHARVRKTLTPLLPAEIKDWFEKATRAI
jgi:Xaa-Pro aminopeptidase